MAPDRSEVDRLVPDEGTGPPAAVVGVVVRVPVVVVVVVRVPARIAGVAAVPVPPAIVALGVDAVSVVIVVARVSTHPEGEAGEHRPWGVGAHVDSEADTGEDGAYAHRERDGLGLRSGGTQAHQGRGDQDRSGNGTHGVLPASVLQLLNAGYVPDRVWACKYMTRQLLASLPSHMPEAVCPAPGTPDSAARRRQGALRPR